MRPFLAPRRPLLASLLFALFAGVGSPARAGDAPPPGHAVEKAEKKDATATVVVPPPSPASQDPMSKLRQRLATKLGVAPSGDTGKPDLISVGLKASASPGHEAEARPSSPSASAPRRKAVAKDSPLHEAGHAAHWDYAGSAGPDAWSTLKPEFAKCSSGARQSPIDIQGGIRVDLEPVQFDYKPGAFRVIDNGHTVQVNVAPGNTIEVSGRRFELVQFHFHRPSEERIEGKQFDMVAHLVHKDLDGRLAVVAVLLERGSAHPLVQSVWNNLPLEKGEELAARSAMNVADLLPSDRRYFTYMGSLTTPPCSEGVLWMVMKTPMPISDAQIDIFAHLYPMNARPVQASAGRLIKQSN
jgi:carbonic anhydrase